MARVERYPGTIASTRRSREAVDPSAAAVARRSPPLPRSRVDDVAQLYEAALPYAVLQQLQAMFALAAVEQPDPRAEHDRHDRDRDVGDQLRCEELADHVAAVDVHAPCVADARGDVGRATGGLTCPSTSTIDHASSRSRR